MPHTLEHVLPATARVNEADNLEIGGCDAVDLANEFGTPLFVFCEQTFRDRAREIKAALPEATIYYAAKAFLCTAMCKLVESEGFGLDVASGGELHVALQARFPPDRLVLHGNNKEDTDILRAVEAGVGRIAIDNIDEIERISAAASSLGNKQRVLVRVTPGVEAHTHEYIQTGQEDSKFGLSVEGGQASDALIRVSKDEALDLTGIHAHIGSNIFSYDPYGKTIEILIEFLAQVRSEHGIEVDEINLGGGIGIPYTAGDFPARLDLLGRLVNESLQTEVERHGLARPKLSFEPGRFLIGNAMVTLYTVGTVKEVPGIRTYVSVDGGMSDNIRPALYQARYAAVLANKARHEPTRVVSIAGMHCESGDILIRDIALPESVERGDILAVGATGAYGYSMASNYNKQTKPAVISVKKGKASTIIRRESYDDLIRLDETPV